MFMIYKHFQHTVFSTLGHPSTNKVKIFGEKVQTMSKRAQFFSGTRAPCNFNCKSHFRLCPPRCTIIGSPSQQPAVVIISPCRPIKINHPVVVGGGGRGFRPHYLISCRAKREQTTHHCLEGCMRFVRSHFFIVI